MSLHKLGGDTASTLNSTTSTLSGGATYTGTAEIGGGPDVGASCFSDVAGTLYFDFSNNGTDWRTFPTSGFACAANVHEFHTAVKLGRYFRARYVNGASAQTTFQLSCYYGAYRQPSAPLNQPLGLDADAILVRPTFPWMDISRGLVSGMSSIKKFGRYDTVGTSFSPICAGGIYRTPQSTSATTLRIKAGGNTNDTAAGSGAREVTLEGLDENFDLVTEAIATNGASASSATTATFTRLFRAYVSASGTYATAAAGSHADEIIIENGAGTEDWATIEFDIGFPLSQSEIGAYSVPRNYSAYVLLDNVSVNTASKVADFLFFHRGDIDQTSAPYTAMRAKSVLTGVTTGVTQLQGRSIPFGPFVGPCDMGFMGQVSQTTGSLSVEFEIFLLAE